MALARDLANRGIPYVWGGKTTAGFDCSGFIYYILKQLGISDTYRTAESLAVWAIPIPASQARPGDLMFLPGHAAIFVGDGRLVDAGNPELGVKERAIWQGGFTYGRIP